MQIFEWAPRMEVGAGRVFVVGDLHGNAGWVGTLFPALHRWAPEIDTVVQLGDFGFDFPSAGRHAIDYWSERAAIKRVIVVPGNHEAWGEWILGEDIALEEGRGAFRVSEVTWITPRPYRLTIGGREVLTLGGAVSVDRHLRTPGRDWWSVEEITDDMVEQAIAGGPADILFTHEPGTTTVPEVQAILDANPHDWPDDSLAASTASRERVEAVWQATRPKFFAHGHLHVYGDRGIPETGQQIVSLHRDGFPGNAGVLDLRDLTFELIPWTAFRRSRP